MATYTDKFSSEYLPKEQMEAALAAFPSVMERLLGECTVMAYYGVGSNLHGDLCHVPMRVYCHALRFFITESIEQRIVVPGESDFGFGDAEGRISVLFCHESDIHVNGSDNSLIQQFLMTKEYSHIPWRSRQEMQANQAHQNGSTNI